MDRPDDVGVPALEATLCQWPQGAKVNHFMTRGIGVWQHAREALVAGSEFVKLIARDGDEAPPWPEDSLTRTWTMSCWAARLTDSCRAMNLSLLSQLSQSSLYSPLDYSFRYVRALEKE